MKSINRYITEKLRISKGTSHTLFPKSRADLINIIIEETKKNGNRCSLNHVDTSNIGTMSYLFGDSNKNFNGDISQWNVSNVTDMYRMFASSSYTGEYGDISMWDVSNVTDMCAMFEYSKYNGDISMWDVSKVKSMHTMFFFSDFDGDLSLWNVSNVDNMGGMFAYSKYTGKNGSIGNWDISNVESMESMFKDSKFNGDISSWDIDGNFCDYHFMFAGCKYLEQKHYPTINHK